MIQTLGGIAALGSSAWLLWDVSTDFTALGSLMLDHTETKAGRIAIGKVAFGYHLKMLGAWALAITSGVLLS